MTTEGFRMKNDIKWSMLAMIVAIGIWVGGGCVTTTEGPDGGSTTSVAGVDVVTTDAEGNAVVTPAVHGAAGMLPPPWGSIAAWGVGLLPWVLNKRSRRQLISKPLAQFKAGDFAGGITSVLAGVGIGHSEPDRLIAYGKLQLKLVEDGLVDPESGKPFASIDKAAPAAA